MRRSDAEPDRRDLTERWSVSYYLTVRENSDTCRSIEMTWENRTPAQLMENLNAFLIATGVPLKVMPVK